MKDKIIVVGGYGQVGSVLDHWKDGQSIDIHEEIMQCTMEIVAKTLFDIDLQEPQYREANQVGKALDQVFQEYVKQYTSIARFLLERLPVALPLPGHKRLQNSVKQLDRVIYDIIEHRSLEVGHGFVSVITLHSWKLRCCLLPLFKGFTSGLLPTKKWFLNHRSHCVPEMVFE
ncbi:hypothetical protein D3C77_369250 [compost metagenome]